MVRPTTRMARSDFLVGRFCKAYRSLGLDGSRGRLDGESDLHLEVEALLEGKILKHARLAIRLELMGSNKNKNRPCFQ